MGNQTMFTLIFAADRAGELNRQAEAHRLAMRQGRRAGSDNGTAARRWTGRLRRRYFGHGRTGHGGEVHRARA
jgi:hypothetical protein